MTFTPGSGGACIYESPSRAKAGDYLIASLQTDSLSLILRYSMYHYLQPPPPPKKTTKKHVLTSVLEAVVTTAAKEKESCCTTTVGGQSV